ncbi:hypothetical protein BKA67DRAFT_647131 [Truncatella angustata]|uniref:Uncharacterized protein n=1 Tax=Truncatella angustata TaxID=152316 RepID=A0A9P8UJB9_9PEZI|nr:uncharacterized protein BKA67DRAFT_647131 [Truncatella angustata]KAH6653174.1 hypothetical protein BKA67DRAFT_647131 [Truncatella angustata]KAH8199416.1 hypothetical protein TruAng_006411 [Truncatella angustata]
MAAATQDLRQRIAYLFQIDVAGLTNHHPPPTVDPRPGDLCPPRWGEYPHTPQGVGAPQIGPENRGGAQGHGNIGGHLGEFPGGSVPNEGQQGGRNGPRLGTGGQQSTGPQQAAGQHQGHLTINSNGAAVVNNYGINAPGSCRAHRAAMNRWWYPAQMSPMYDGLPSEAEVARYQNEYYRPPLVSRAAQGNNPYSIWRFANEHTPGGVPLEMFPVPPPNLPLRERNTPGGRTWLWMMEQLTESLNLGRRLMNPNVGRDNARSLMRLADSVILGVSQWGGLNRARLDIMARYQRALYVQLGLLGQIYSERYDFVGSIRNASWYGPPPSPMTMDAAMYYTGGGGAPTDTSGVPDGTVPFSGSLDLSMTGVGDASDAGPSTPITPRHYDMEDIYD